MFLAVLLYDASLVVFAGLWFLFSSMNKCFGFILINSCFGIKKIDNPGNLINPILSVKYSECAHKRGLLRDIKST